MQIRVQSMAHLHELLYGSKDLASIDPAEYLNAIAGELSLNHGKSLIRMDAQSDILSIDEAMPFGLIATELMTNALKYAYPQANLDSAGKIFVSYNRSGVERVLEVRDEGVGLPPDFDLENSVSMGFILVRTLAEQIGGKLSISEAKPGNPSPGLRVVLVFSSAPRTQ